MSAMHRTLHIGCCGFLTLLCLGSPALRADQALIRQQDVDGDGVAEVVLENRFVRLIAAPARGGSIISYRAQNSPTEMLAPDPRTGVGLLGEVFKGPGLDGEQPEPTTCRIDADARQGQVTFTRQGNASAAAQQVTLTKTLRLTADSPIVTASIELQMGAGPQRHFPFRYWSHNRVGPTDIATTNWYPSLRGVEQLTYTVGHTPSSRQITVSNPPRSWLAVTTEAGPGLALLIDPLPQTCYTYAKGRIATLEWGFEQVILRPGQSWTMQCTLLPTMHLPQVDGVVAGAAGALLLEPDSLRGRVLLSGSPGPCDVQLRWSRLPDRHWQAGPATTLQLSTAAPAAMDFDLGATGEGTFVVQALLSRDGQPLGELEQSLTRGTSTGRYVLLPAQINTNHLGAATRQGALALTPDQPLLVRKILPLDSRLVRGVAHAPVDGRTDTRNSQGGISEWAGQTNLPAVNYGFEYQNNGVHLSLPGAGFDAVQLRGGWSGRVYADWPDLHAPTAQTPALLEVPGQVGGFHHRFSQRQTPARLSFFTDAARGNPLADITLLQVEEDRQPGAAKMLGIGPATEPDDLTHAVIESRWGPVYRARRLTPGASESVRLAAGEFVHLLTPEQDPQLGVAAVRVVCQVTSVEPGALLTLRVHDVLDPTREALGVDFTVPGPGRYAVRLDVPDQVFLPASAQWHEPPRFDGALTPPPVVWLSLASDAPIELAQVQVALDTVPRTAALRQAEPWRKFLLRGLFSTMSEPRPWMHLQDGLPVLAQLADDPNIKPYAAALRELLRFAQVNRLLLPEDDETRQYHQWLYQNMDRRKPQPPAVVPDVPGAPRWAVLQRENFLLLRDIAQWWLDHRQTSDGQLGGGVNDDTDLYQTWQCFPMIESAPLGERLRAGSEKLGDLAWEHHLEEGLNRRSMDPLHAYEEGVNQLALNAWWFHGDPVHLERVMASARSSMKLLVKLPDGRVHFGGPLLGVDEARQGFAKLGNTQAFARLFLQPMYELALYNRSPQAIAAMEAWGQTWANYQQPRAFVEQVDIPTGKPVKLWPYARGPADEWTALYQVTGNARWLQPLMLGMVEGEYWGFAASYGDMPQGALVWPQVQQEMLQRQFGNAGYSGVLLTGNRDGWEKTLEHSLSWFARFGHMHTAAEPTTDRVLTFPATAALAGYLGAGPNRNRWVRLQAVSYEGFHAQDFAALVWVNRDDALRVALYNFRDQPLTGTLRLWRLQHGVYRVRIGPDADDDGQLDQPTEEHTRQLQRYSALPITLPAQQVTVVECDQVQPLDDLLTRPDLALSVREVTVEGTALHAVAHNIGAAAAPVVAAVLDQQGNVLVQQDLGLLDAPLDLQPRRLPITLRLPRAVEPGWWLVLDPRQAVAEITEHNNEVALPAVR